MSGNYSQMVQEKIAHSSKNDDKATVAKYYIGKSG